jgi:[acyl-carrier-protein] S-malonyltransferase
MTTAFLFAGQGVDPPWVGRCVLERPAAEPLLAAASRATGVDVPRLLARGGRELADPAILQPALVAACLCVAAELAAAGVAPALVGGHSLGELAAWAASGCVGAVDAIAAAAVRGRLMARQARLAPGGMAAVRGGPAVLARALDAGRALGTIDPTGHAAAPPRAASSAAPSPGEGAQPIVLAAENAPDEHVVSGSAAALAAVLAAVPATRLPVAGAWHSPAMAGAFDELREALAAVPTQTPHAVLVCNRTGGPADPAALPALLAGQLVHPVRWVTVLGTLRALGAARYVIVGPGKLVRALIRRTLGDVAIEIVDSMRDVARVAA